MIARLNPFEQFIVLFENLISVTKGEPSRIKAFWEDSPTIRAAAEAMEQFLWSTDLERPIFHGSRKYWRQAPDGFDAQWREYDSEWAPQIAKAQIGDFDLMDLVVKSTDSSATPVSSNAADDDDLWPIDLEYDYEFDPVHHDGAAAIDLGVTRLYDDMGRNEENGESQTANMDRIALGALDYLTETIGLDIGGVFRRWRRTPVIFMPSHVSNRHGDEKGSLYDLLNDAVRAYVFGATAASMAMCRAVMEKVLKDHYVRNHAGLDLAEIIALASHRYDFVQRKRLDHYRTAANCILHQYSGRSNVSAQDDRTIHAFLKTLKFLIERAPVALNSKDKPRRPNG
jgi:hypothetical protein